MKKEQSLSKIGRVSRQFGHVSCARIFISQETGRVIGAKLFNPMQSIDDLYRIGFYRDRNDYPHPVRRKPELGEVEAEIQTFIDIYEENSKGPKQLVFDY